MKLAVVLCSTEQMLVAIDEEVACYSKLNLCDRVSFLVLGLEFHIDFDDGAVVVVVAVVVHH